MAHGYPSSFVEFTRMIGPLVDPERTVDAPRMHSTSIPSLPGFAFSTPATRSGLGIKGAAAAFDLIMQGLGYERYGVHGGDVGAGIAEELSILAGDRIIGSLIVTDPGAIATEYTPPTDHLTPEEQDRLQALKAARVEDFGYLGLQTTRPQSIAYGLTDSPVMQLTWIVEKVREWTDPARELPEDAVDIDHLLTLVSVYWFGKVALARRTSCTRRRTPRRRGAGPTTGHRVSCRSARSPWSAASSTRTTSAPIGTSTPRAATSPPWSSRTCWSATCGRSSRRSAESFPGMICGPPTP